MTRGLSTPEELDAEAVRLAQTDDLLERAKAKEAELERLIAETDRALQEAREFQERANALIARANELMARKNDLLNEHRQLTAQAQLLLSDKPLQ